MTEAEWLSSDDPAAMLSLVTGGGDRKLRLFACACTRQVWHLLTDERSRKAVEVAERFADGGAAEEARACACHDAWAVCDERQQRVDDDLAGHWAWLCCGMDDDLPGFLTHNNRPGEPAMQANLLRDIIGNPFRSVRCRQTGNLLGTDTVMVRSDGGLAGCDCTWLTPTVLAIARSAYEERPGRVCDVCKNQARTVQGWTTAPDTEGRWRRCKRCDGAGRIHDGSLDAVTLSILADALVDADCPEDHEIVKHLRGWEKCRSCIGMGRWATGGWQEAKCARYCEEGDAPGWVRSPGPHVRGCWAIDLILGKS